MDGTVQEPTKARRSTPRGPHRETHRLRIKLAQQRRSLRGLQARVEARIGDIEATAAELKYAESIEQKFAQYGSAGQ